MSSGKAATTEILGKAMLSVIVPTCKRAKDLFACLEALQLQIDDGIVCEIIVTDDGDVSDTQRYCGQRFPFVRWTQGPRKGPAANRNHGVKHSSGEWLIFLDDDLKVKRGWLAAYQSAICSVGPETVFEGRIANDRKAPSLLWEAPLNLNGHTSFYCSANFAVSRHLFSQLGGFDERYLSGVYAEDVEFGARAAASGAKFVFLAEASAEHLLRRLPNPRALAKRWEGKLIYAHDQGASPFRLLWNLPWHALRIIQWRFSQRETEQELFQARLVFFQEWLWVIWMTPGWVAKWATRPRSDFWTRHTAKHGPVPKYGF